MNKLIWTPCGVRAASGARQAKKKRLRMQNDRTLGKIHLIYWILEYQQFHQLALPVPFGCCMHNNVNTI